MWIEKADLPLEERNQISRADSTLLCILAQLESRDYKFDDEGTQLYYN